MRLLSLSILTALAAGLIAGCDYDDHDYHHHYRDREAIRYAPYDEPVIVRYRDYDHDNWRYDRYHYDRYGHYDDGYYDRRRFD